MLNKSTRNERQVMSVENTNTGKAEITNKHLNGLIKKKTIDGTIINSIVMSHYNSTDTLQQEIEHLQHGSIFDYNDLDMRKASCKYTIYSGDELLLD
jgi:hypothetical protein